MRSRRHRSQGLTLIEIMVVIVIMAMVVGGVSYGFSAVTRSKLRGTATNIGAAARVAYSYAISNGVTTRVVFDAAQRTIAIEQASGVVVLANPDDEEGQASGGAIDPWAAARQRVETPQDPVHSPASFGPLTREDGSTMEKYQPSKLPGSVRYLRMYLPHEPSPRDDGVGAIYFFPNGTTEHAVIQLTDDSEHVFSVEIHPLTARARVHSFAFEPEPIGDDPEDQSEVEDPG